MRIETDGMNGRFDLWQAVAKEDVLVPFTGPCALEDDNFPFEAISDVAEVESWRKEINRPVYHIHKWWAQRLGTVFRAVTLGALAPSGTNVLSAFYRPTRVQNLTVFDPFMGSGTTIGEAAKLGARAIGRDINPVAHFLVRNALAFHDREAVFRTFRDIERDVADKIRAYYQDGATRRNEGRRSLLFLGKAGGLPGMRMPSRSVLNKDFRQTFRSASSPGRKSDVSLLRRSEFRTR